MSMEEALITHRGGCHCGAVRFEVDAPSTLRILSCNCSRCRQLGYEHLIVPEDRFRLQKGRDHLTAYTFNTGVARHLFCATCGVQSFYVPRSRPDGYSINARCLDEGTVIAKHVESFDGQRWEESAAALTPLPDRG